jgi:glycosyltransferase involved in cell wall biosynthesis
MKSPLITTIIPTFQRPQLLKRAVSSVLNQTYTQLQVQVYDNASGDETKDIVQEYMQSDPRVKYHCHPHNIGMMSNYAYALKEVQTPYFSLLSDDDVISPWFCDVALQDLQKFPEAAFCACSTTVLSETGDTIRVPLDLWTREGYFVPPDGLLEMISKYPIPTTILFNRKVLSEISIDMDNALMWDCDFLLQIAAKYPIIINKRPCGIFLHHEGSYSNAQDFQKWKRAYRILEQRLQHNPLLSIEVKNAAVKLIKNDLKMTKRAFILRSLFDKKFTEACQYAELFYKKYGLSSSSIMLWIASHVCRVFPPAIYPLYLLRKIKKMMNNKTLARQGK